MCVGRACASRRLRGLFVEGWQLSALVRFHTAHKLLLMAHSPAAYRRLGRLVAASRDVPRPELERLYADQFTAALDEVVTRGRHTNVLHHMAGYLKERLDRAARRELLGVIEAYRRGSVPLAAPIALLRHHVRSLRIAYLDGQVYLEAQSTVDAGAAG